MKIWIDPGHGGVWPDGDPGVVTKDGKKIESYYNWMYANALQDYLEERGFEAELTRKQDDYKIPYSQRTRPQTKDDLLISLHFDTYLGGRKLIYYANQPGSQDLAEAVDEFFGSGLLKASSESRFNGLYIDDTKAPAILIEVDRIDRATLDESVVEAFCRDVEQGIRKYLGEEISAENNSGQIEGDDKITTPFRRVFIVSPDNNSEEVPVERMSMVGDKLYIAPSKKWFD